MSHREPTVPNARVAQPLAARDREPLLPSRVRPVLSTPKRRDESIPEWEDTPLLPVRTVPVPVAPSTLAPVSRALGALSPVRQLRPIELWFVVALTMVFTLVGSALLARFGLGVAPAQQAAQPIVSNAPPTLASHSALAPASSAESQIPIVKLTDLPIEPARGARRQFTSKQTSR